MRWIKFFFCIPSKASNVRVGGGGGSVVTERYVAPVSLMSYHIQYVQNSGKYYMGDGSPAKTFQMKVFHLENYVGPCVSVMRCG